MILYQGLKDSLFGAPGRWDLKKCPNPECGLVWVDPMPIEEDIGKAYETYYTHGGEINGRNGNTKQTIGTCSFYGSCMFYLGSLMILAGNGDWFI